MVTMVERMTRVEEKVDNLVTVLLGDNGWINNKSKEIESINNRLSKQEGASSAVRWIFGGGVFIGLIIGGIKLIYRFF